MNSTPPAGTRTWHILTGEYPPQLGGVSDYTELLALELARAGERVQVWCPQVEHATPAVNEIEIHRFPGFFSWRGWRAMGRGLSADTVRPIVLVQYVPNAFGWHGMNAPFCLWLVWRSRVRGDDVRVMFHEPFFYFGWRRFHRNVLALIQRLMAFLLLTASRRTYLSTESWVRYLRPYAWLGRAPMVALPIPSTIPVLADPQAVCALRKRLTAGFDDACLVGHFGTYAETAVLRNVFTALLDRNTRVYALFLGKGGEALAAELKNEFPALAGRIHAPGFLERGEISLHLQACDLMLQPYPDGVTTRRTSVMAPLSHGVATLTMQGKLTEPLWKAYPQLPMAEADDGRTFLDLACNLLKDRSRLKDCGVSARALYEQHFSVARTVESLRSNVPVTTKP